MKFIAAADKSFVPAGHENPLAPGVLKKVLFVKDDLREGRIQMVNWAKLPAGNRFAAHYHESMQEIFIMMTGQVRLTDNRTTLAHASAGGGGDRLSWYLGLGVESSDGWDLAAETTVMGIILWADHCFRAGK